MIKWSRGIGFVASLISASTFGDTLVSFLRFPGKANRFLNLSSNCPSTVKVTASTETKGHLRTTVPNILSHLSLLLFGANYSPTPMPQKALLFGAHNLIHTSER